MPPSLIDDPPDPGVPQSMSPTQRVPRRQNDGWCFTQKQPEMEESLDVLGQAQMIQSRRTFRFRMEILESWSCRSLNPSRNVRKTHGPTSSSSRSWRSCWLYLNRPLDLRDRAARRSSSGSRSTNATSPAKEQPELSKTGLKRKLDPAFLQARSDEIMSTSSGKQLGIPGGLFQFRKSGARRRPRTCDASSKRLRGQSPLPRRWTRPT